MESNKDLILKLQELNNKLLHLIKTTRETYNIMDNALENKKEKIAEITLLAQSANKHLN